MIKSSFLFLLSLLWVACSGCSSYQLGSTYDPGFKTIFIENFKSEVDEPMLENLVTTTVIKQFQKDGTFQVTDLAQADVILKGRITSFSMSPVRFSRANELTPTEASMAIEVKYVLIKRNETKSYFEGQATGDTSFFIGNDLQSDKRQGIPLVAEKLGSHIVSALADGW